MNKPPTPPTERGTAQEFKDAKGGRYWRARITYPDGERLWLKPRFASRLLAEEYADEKSREAEARGITIAEMAPPARMGAGETCADWRTRYLAFCQERGLSTVATKRMRWSRWIGKHLDGKPMADITRDDVENIRDALDAAIRVYTRLDPDKTKDRLSPKTAQNVWGELTVSFGEACTSKRRDLRVRDTNPTSGVQAPETGASKSKVYPYPSEFLAVASCWRIPLAWRELHAVAVFTYARPGELHVLTWADVDLDDRQITITKAWDYDNEKIKPTKTHETRTIPIEPNLLPLLRHMRERTKGKGLVVPALSSANANKIAIIMREHFDLAGCKRPRLTTRSNAELQLRFRSWRDAGITWSIVRGDDVVKVQRRAGHKLISTTMPYIVEAENRGATFGTPFPVLPACLVPSSKRASKLLGPIANRARNTGSDECRRRESNP